MSSHSILWTLFSHGNQTSGNDTFFKMSQWSNIYNICEVWSRYHLSFLKVHSIWLYLEFYLIYRLRCEHILCLYYDNLLSLVLLEVLTEPGLVNIIQRVRVYPQQIGLLFNSEEEQTYFWHRTGQKIENNYNQTDFVIQRKYLLLWFSSSHLVE